MIYFIILFIESMDNLERMDVRSDSNKESGGSKLAYSSSIPTIKPLATNTGISYFHAFLLFAFFVLVKLVNTTLVTI